MLVCGAPHTGSQGPIEQLVFTPFQACFLPDFMLLPLLAQILWS